MKYSITLFLLIYSIVSYASSADLKNEQCTQIYVNTSNAGGKLSAREVGEFLNAIDCKYFSSAEGGQFGSELIIIVLENSTYEFINEFDKLSPLLQGVILESVRTPIHDGFNFQRIHDNISRTKTTSATKSILISAIYSAAKGLNRDIKKTL